MSHEHVVRARKMAALRDKDYRRVDVDLDNRIVVEVHEERFAEPELYRRVWGPEWPVVRSERWKPPMKKPPKETPDDQQFQFHSREY